MSARERRDLEDDDGGSDVPSSSISRTRDDGLDDSDDDPSTGASSGIGGSIPGAPSGGSGGGGRDRDDDDDDDRVRGGTAGGGRGPRFDDDPSPAPEPDPEPQTRTETFRADTEASRRVGGSGDPSDEPEPDTVDVGGAADSGQGPRVGISDQSPFRDVRATAQLDTQTVTDLTPDDIQIDGGVAQLRDEALGIERDARREQQAESAREQLRSDAAEQFETAEDNIDITRDGDRFVAEQDLTNDQLLIDRATGGRFEPVVDAGENLRGRAAEPLEPVIDVGRDVRQAARESVPDIDPRGALAVGAAGVAVPEPSTSVGGAIIAAGALGAIGAAELQRRRSSGELETPDSREPIFSGELGIGDVNPTTELDTPSSRQSVTRSELDTPDGSQPVAGSELSVPDAGGPVTGSEVDVPTVEVGGVLQQGRQRQREDDDLDRVRSDFELNEDTLEDVDRTGELPEAERLPQIRDQLQRRQDEFVDPDLFDPTRDPFVFPGSGVGTQPATDSGTGVGEGVGTGTAFGTGTGFGSGLFGGVGLGLDGLSDTALDTGFDQQQEPLRESQLLRSTAPVEQTTQQATGESNVFETTNPTTTPTGTETVPTPTPTNRRRLRLPDPDGENLDDGLAAFETAVDIDDVQFSAQGLTSVDQQLQDNFGGLDEP